MRRQVVPGGPVMFKEDMPIDEAAVGTPLGLPAPPLGHNELTLLYKGRFFVLNRKPDEHFCRVWGTTYGIEETESPKKLEEAFRTAHAGEIAAAQRDWLTKVLPKVDLTTALQTYGEHLKTILQEKVGATGTATSGIPRHSVGTGTIATLNEGTLLTELEGCERMLLLDGKAYDLLTLPEYLAKFSRAFDAGFITSLSGSAKAGTPDAVIRLIEANLDKVDKKTAEVLKGKVHFNERTFALFLDGVYFVPEYIGAANEIVDRYSRLFERRTKLDAIENLLT